MKKNSTKGQAILISHAILVGISVSLVLVVVTTFGDIREDYQEFIAGNDIEQTCFIIRTAAEKVYRETKFVSATNTTYGKVRVVLPERLADLKYSVRFENRTAYLDTSPVQVNASCKVGLNATYTGFTSGGVTEISYAEHSSGARELKFERVG